MKKKHLFIFEGKPATGKSDLARLIGNNNAIIFDDLYHKSKDIKDLVEMLATFNSPRTTYIAIVPNLETKVELETLIAATTITDDGTPIMDDNGKHVSLKDVIKVSEVKFRRAW